MCPLRRKIPDMFRTLEQGGRLRADLLPVEMAQSSSSRVELLVSRATLRRRIRDTCQILGPESPTGAGLYSAESARSSENGVGLRARRETKRVSAIEAECSAV
jgi:hypothetical protein